MGKNDRKNNKNNKRSESQGAGNQKPVTKDTLAESRNQAEFERVKEILLQQALEEIADLEKMKSDAQEAAGKAKAAQEDLEAKKKELERQRDELRKQFDEMQGKYREAERFVNTAKEQAEKVKGSADAYASDVQKKAEKDRLKVQAEAAEEARMEWIALIEKLREQREEIVVREAALEKGRRELDRELRKVEDDKEAMEELKEDLQNRKTRYDKANPAKVAALESELNDERKMHQDLRKQYQGLTEKCNALQAWMDTVKTEVEDSEDGTKIASMHEVVSELQRMRGKYEELKAVCEQYSDGVSIAALKEKAQKTEKLERTVEALELERNRYREEAVAARSATRELEVVKREAEAANALREHLQKELESHKTALESRTGDACPALSKVDAETEGEDFQSDVARRMTRPAVTSLKDLVSHVKHYAGSRRDEEQLYYTDNDIRAFLAGMAVSRLLILQGMSGTGKSSLPRIFSEAISGFHRLIPVESSWRDRNELLGYYNDFHKKFNVNSFTIELYRSSKERCQEIPTFIVLDEMNLARIEYYFSDFLAILQEPDHAKWLIELVASDMRTLPMELPEAVKEKMERDDPSVFSIWDKIERSRQGDRKAEATDDDKGKLASYLEKLGRLTGAKDLVDGRKIRVTDNVWFVGTANRDESTFEISDKVYDRAQVVSLNRKGKSEKNYVPSGEKYISVSDLEKLFREAVRDNKTKGDVEHRLNELDNVLMEYFDVSFGNRIVVQTVQFAAVFVAAGGKLEDALDYQISTKILRKVIASDDEEALLALEDVAKDYPETRRLIGKRLKELA